MIANEDISYSYTNDLLSSSIIVILVAFGLPSPISLGNDSGNIIRLKSSSISSTLSSIIGMLNTTVVFPEGIVTLYGPDGS